MAEQTGSTHTAIVEQALFHYSKVAAQIVASRERARDWQARRKAKEELEERELLRREERQRPPIVDLPEKPDELPSPAVANAVSLATMKSKKRRRR